jgi:hypothetical protein
MKASNLKSFALGFGIAIAALGIYALAATLNTFKAGDVVSAQLINDNFTNLNADIATLNTKVTETAAKVTDAPGFNSTEGDNSNIAVPNPAASIKSVTLEAPAAGFAIVTADLNFTFAHVTGTNTTGEFSLSKTAGAAANVENSRIVGIGPNWPTNTEMFQPVALTEVFAVTKGANTFHLNALRSSGAAGTQAVRGVKLTVIYVSTRYGTGVTVN